MDLLLFFCGVIALAMLLLNIAWIYRAHSRAAERKKSISDSRENASLGEHISVRSAYLNTVHQVFVTEHIVMPRVVAILDDEKSARMASSNDKVESSEVISNEEMILWGEFVSKSADFKHQAQERVYH